MIRPTIAAALRVATLTLGAAARPSEGRWRVLTYGLDGEPAAWPVLDVDSYLDAASVATVWHGYGWADVRVIDRWCGRAALALSDRIPPSPGVRQ